MQLRLVQLGCIPVFADCLSNTGNINPEGIRAALTLRTKGLVVTQHVGTAMCYERNSVALQGY